MKQSDRACRQVHLRQRVALSVVLGLTAGMAAPVDAQESAAGAQDDGIGEIAEILIEFRS